MVVPDRTEGADDAPIDLSAFEVFDLPGEQFYDQHVGPQRVVIEGETFWRFEVYAPFARSMSVGIAPSSDADVPTAPAVLSKAAQPPSGSETTTEADVAAPTPPRSFEMTLSTEKQGLWQALVPASDEAGKRIIFDGTEYGFSIDGDASYLPDPLARFNRAHRPFDPSLESELPSARYFPRGASVVGPHIDEPADVQLERLLPRRIYEIDAAKTNGGTVEDVIRLLPILAALRFDAIKLLPMSPGLDYDPTGTAGYRSDLSAKGNPVRTQRQLAEVAAKYGIQVVNDLVGNHIFKDGTTEKFHPHLCRRWDPDLAVRTVTDGVNIAWQDAKGSWYTHNPAATPWGWAPNYAFGPWAQGGRGQLKAGVRQRKHDGVTTERVDAAHTLVGNPAAGIDPVDDIIDEAHNAILEHPDPGERPLPDGAATYVDGRSIALWELLGREGLDDFPIAGAHANEARRLRSHTPAELKRMAAGIGNYLDVPDEKRMAIVIASNDHGGYNHAKGRPPVHRYRSADEFMILHGAMTVGPTLITANVLRKLQPNVWRTQFTDPDHREEVTMGRAREHGLPVDEMVDSGGPDALTLGKPRGRDEVGEMDQLRFVAAANGMHEALTGAAAMDVVFPEEDGVIGFRRGPATLIGYYPESGDDVRTLHIPPGHLVLSGEYAGQDLASITLKPGEYVLLQEAPAPGKEPVFRIPADLTFDNSFVPSRLDRSGELLPGEDERPLLTSKQHWGLKALEAELDIVLQRAASLRTEVADGIIDDDLETNLAKLNEARVLEEFVRIIERLSGDPRFDPIYFNLSGNGIEGNDTRDFSTSVEIVSALVTDSLHRGAIPLPLEVELEVLSSYTNAIKRLEQGDESVYVFAELQWRLEEQAEEYKQEISVVPTGPLNLFGGQIEIVSTTFDPTNDPELADALRTVEHDVDAKVGPGTSAYLGRIRNLAYAKAFAHALAVSKYDVEVVTPLDRIRPGSPIVVAAAGGTFPNVVVDEALRQAQAAWVKDLRLFDPFSSTFAERHHELVERAAMFVGRSTMEPAVMLRARAQLDALDGPELRTDGLDERDMDGDRRDHDVEEHAVDRPELWDPAGRPAADTPAVVDEFLERVALHLAPTGTYPTIEEALQHRALADAVAELRAIPSSKRLVEHATRSATADLPSSAVVESFSPIDAAIGRQVGRAELVRDCASLTAWLDATADATDQSRGRASAEIRALASDLDSPADQPERTPALERAASVTLTATVRASLEPTARRRRTRASDGVPSGRTELAISPPLPNPARAADQLARLTLKALEDHGLAPTGRINTGADRPAIEAPGASVVREQALDAIVQPTADSVDLSAVHRELVAAAVSAQGLDRPLITESGDQRLSEPDVAPQVALRMGDVVPMVDRDPREPARMPRRLLASIEGDSGESRDTGISAGVVSLTALRSEAHERMQGRGGTVSALRDAPSPRVDVVIERATPQERGRPDRESHGFSGGDPSTADGRANASARGGGPDEVHGRRRRRRPGPETIAETTIARDPDPAREIERGTTTSELSHPGTQRPDVMPRLGLASHDERSMDATATERLAVQASEPAHPLSRDDLARLQRPEADPHQRDGRGGRDEIL